MRFRFAALLVPLPFTLALTASPSPAVADVQHVVARGHTLEAIANRYKVSVKSIVDANHLKDSKHLRVGDVLTIPKVDPPASTKAKADKDKDEKTTKKSDKSDKTDKVAKLDKSKPAHGREPTTYAAKPKTPGVVHIKRLAEETDIRIADKRGHASPTALKSFEKVMRSQGNLTHPIDARLVALVGVVSNHFGSRKIEVISGFRPFTPTQYTPHSNHNHGKAIDFRILGVPNEAVRDFCRTLKNTGCGYYPNSTFVHMDVRDKEAFWIDYSKPGEPPRYNAPNLEADEGTSDVHDDHAGGNTAPSSPSEGASAPGGSSDTKSDETPSTPATPKAPAPSQPPQVEDTKPPPMKPD